MTLLEWVNTNGGQGSGIVTELMRESRVSFRTIGNALKGARIRDLSVARALSRATKGRVSVRELMQLTEEDCAPPVEDEPRSAA